MTDRATDNLTAPLCGCSRPLVETVRSCARCGHELAGEKFALSPKAQRLAGVIAELVIERLDDKERVNPDSKQGQRTDLLKGQLSLGGEK